MKSLFFLPLLLFSIYCSGEAINISCGPAENIYIEKAKVIIENAYSNIGYDVTFKHTSFERSILSASSGESDGELFRFKPVANLYASLLIVNEPLFYIRTNAYSGNYNVTIESWDDVYNYKVAIVKGIKSVEERLDGYNIIKANTHKEAFILLKRGIVEIVITGNITAEKIIKEEQLDIYVKNAFVLDEMPVYHLIHEKNRELIPKLEDAIREINKQ